MEKKPKLSKKHIALAATLILTIGAVTLGVQQLRSIYVEEEQLLPALPSHADVAKQPRLTYKDSLKIKLPPDTQAMPSTKCKPQNSNWQSIENKNSGVSMNINAWHNLHLFLPTGSVLWIDKMSATCGDLINVHASLYGSDSSDSSPLIKVLRVGGYKQSGAKEVWSTGPVKLHRNRVPAVKSLTRMIETQWPVTTSFTVGDNWIPGLYIVETQNKNGEIENIAPLIIKGHVGASKLLLIHSTLTWSAYNSFGGRSAYLGPINSARERSRVISMDRPIIGSGVNHVDRDAIAFVQFLESKNIQVDQIADTDLDRNPSILTHYPAVILSGHPEYMTNRMFKSLIAARNNGINLAFFGSNTAYWQVRLESSPTGSNRRMAIYRDPKLDPVTSPTLISIQFNNSRINMLPSLITGETTAGVHVAGDMKVIDKPSWLNIPQNAHLNGWSPNSEIDSSVVGNFAPPNPHIIFSGKFQLTSLPKHNQALSAVLAARSYEAQTVWFTTPSGSAVFVAGINYWACELSFTCMEGNVNDATRSVLQSVTSQVLNLWQTPAVGRTLH